MLPLSRTIESKVLVRIPAVVRSASATAVSATMKRSAQAPAPPRAGAAAAGLAEGGRGLDARGLERGRRAQERGGQERHQHAVGEHPRVEARPEDLRQLGRHDVGDRADPPDRGDDAQGATGQRDHETLGQELAADPRPARAQRQPHPQLGAARVASRQVEVHQIGAGDHQHQGRHGEQDVLELGVDSSREEVAERLDVNAPTAIGLGELRLEALRRRRRARPGRRRPDSRRRAGRSRRSGGRSDRGDAARDRRA